MLSRAATQLYYLHQLRRAGLGADDLFGYYKAVVRSVVEYDSQVWNSGLTKVQSADLRASTEMGYAYHNPRCLL